MVNFEYINTKKEKIKQMPLKELLDYGEKLFVHIISYRKKEKSSMYFWDEGESDQNFNEEVFLAEIVNTIFEKENPVAEKCKRELFETFLYKSKTFSDFLRLLHKSSSETNSK